MITFDFKNELKISQLGDYSIMNLGEIIRYNNRTKIKHENVAEHSFYVIFTAMQICKQYNLSEKTTAKVLELAMIHDVPEMMLGDIPFETKENNPVLTEILNVAEYEAMKDTFPSLADLYKEFLNHETSETLPYLVVKLADTAGVLQYSNRELDLGNNSKQMLEINKNSKIRVESYIKKIESLLEV